MDIWVSDNKVTRSAGRSTYGSIEFKYSKIFIFFFFYLSCLEISRTWKKSFSCMILLSLCLDADTYDKNINCRKFFLIPKCLYFWNKELIRVGFLFPEISLQNAGNQKKLNFYIGNNQTAVAISWSGIRHTRFKLINNATMRYNVSTF